MLPIKPLKKRFINLNNIFLRSMKAADFSAKVEELVSVYDPFDATPEEWKACKGSSPLEVSCHRK